MIALQVKHSFRLNLKPLSSWVSVYNDGIILTGHCECMAGHGEVCRHVGAVLFVLEAWGRRASEIDSPVSFSCQTKMFGCAVFVLRSMFVFGSRVSISKRCHVLFYFEIKLVEQSLFHSLRPGIDIMYRCASKVARSENESRRYGIDRQHLLGFRTKNVTI